MRAASSPGPDRLAAHAMIRLRHDDPDSWDEAAQGAARAGYDALEVLLRDPAALDRGRVAGALGGAGLEAVCLTALPPDADVPAGREQARRAEEHPLRCLDVAHALGAGYLGGVVHAAASHHEAPAPPGALDRVVEHLRVMAVHASRAGVVLGVELVNRYESRLLTTVEEGMGVLAEVDHDAVVLHLDTFHMTLEERDPAAAVGLAAPRLGYLHVSESTRGRLGEGSADLAAVFEAVAEAGWAGRLGFESFRGSTAPPGLRAAMGLWRDHWDDPDQVAADARRIIVDDLAAARRRTGWTP